MMMENMMNEYRASAARYDGHMPYRVCGHSGLSLPEVSFGTWHNFGSDRDIFSMKRLVRKAFDSGITYFDCANNYGPEPGAAEENLGRILATDLKRYRDELLIATKAGYPMWEGPYGNWGSRKHLIASLDQSLHRLQLDYVDIFYHHRPDPHTPVEETESALEQIVRSGKALYIGLSKYDPEQLMMIVPLLVERHVPFVVEQIRYSLLNRRVETEGLLVAAHQAGIGLIAFSPLAQGLLTDRYMNGIPDDSRIARKSPFLKQSDLTAERVSQIRALTAIARHRGQSLAQMSLAWILSHSEISSVLIGASRPEQIHSDVAAVASAPFTPDELNAIDAITLPGHSDQRS